MVGFEVRDLCSTYVPVGEIDKVVFIVRELLPHRSAGWTLAVAWET